MDASELYDLDFVAWTEQQAAALRRMPDSNSLDREHLAEEIESLGTRDVREVQSLLDQIMLHALKILLDPGSPSVPDWRKEVTAFQRQARRAFASSMQQYIDLNEIWADALKELDAGGSPVIMKHSRCPASLDECVASDFDIDRFLALISAAGITKSNEQVFRGN
jgi:hypothetical protein